MKRAQTENIIQNIKALRMVFELLRIKVGAPISYQSIAEDVTISPNIRNERLDGEIKVVRAENFLAALFL
jgi:hypothetical protein